MEETRTQKVAFWVVFFSKLLVWVLGSICIYWLILKLTDHSPTSEQVATLFIGIMSGGYVALIGVILYFVSKLNKHIGKSDHFMHYSEKRFEAIGRRFDKVDERFQRVDDRFQKMDDKFNVLDHKIDDGFNVLDRKIDDKFNNINRKMDKLLMRRNYRPGKASS